MFIFALVMTNKFYKYQGTGNDFIMIDNRSKSFSKNDAKRIAQLCNRRYGIGADGLIVLEDETGFDFRMIYFNADGQESTMCGNGGRCVVAFAKQLGLVDNQAYFLAIDGSHHAHIDGNQIDLQMQEVSGVIQNDSYLMIDTGSPHYISLVSNLQALDVKQEGAKIRYSSSFVDEGINVNFVEQLDASTFAIRTYERGVEDETLSCGTGATAAAIAMFHTKKTSSQQILLKTQGGQLKVRFEVHESTYRSIWLSGPATFVFEGQVK